jgi:hypothetical protein
MPTKEQLINTMIFQLNALKTGTQDINMKTIHEAILSYNDGYGITSKKIYELAIKFSIEKAKIKKVTWPTDWMKLSVSDLADAIFQI